MKRFGCAMILLTTLLGACQTAPVAVDKPSLARQWIALQRAEPTLALHEAAQRLSVSEAQLLASSVGDTAVRLQDGPDAARALLRRILDLGQITASTRNQSVTIEVVGVARKNPLPDSMKLPTGNAARDQERAQRLRNFVEGYFGGPIDLRFDFDRWQTAMVILRPGQDARLHRSLHFFDDHGQAVLNVQLRNPSAVRAFDRLVTEFRHPQQDAAVVATPSPKRPTERLDSAIDGDGLRQAWKDVTDGPQFTRLIMEYGVSREQALRLAPPGATRQLSPGAARTLLEGAVAQRIPLRVSVGNHGITQLYSGTIQNVDAGEQAVDVRDAAFRLRLQDKAFARGWMIELGDVRSVEFYDKDGGLAVTFSGQRERLQPQSQAWRDLLDKLPVASTEAKGAY